MTPPLIMGIINVTPDSFSGDGLFRDEAYVTRALRQAESMLEDGAAILDIGGESSRPGSVPVPAKEELARVIPVINAIKGSFPQAVIGVDTAKADVAEQALDAGCAIINDITALQGDPRMSQVAARHGAKIVLMHNRANANGFSADKKKGRQYDAPAYQNVVEDVRRDLAEKVAAAIKAGIEKRKIILDPGIGFGKTPEQNLALIARLRRLKELGHPVLVGLSRKSFIGHVLDVPVDERMEGTAAGVTAAVLQGADILRVHDVKFMARVVKMAAALRDAAQESKRQ